MLSEIIKDVLRGIMLTLEYIILRAVWTQDICRKKEKQTNIFLLHALFERTSLAHLHLVVELFAKILLATVRKKTKRAHI